MVNHDFLFEIATYRAPQEHIPRSQTLLRSDRSHGWISRVVALSAGGRGRRGVEKIREFQGKRPIENDDLP